ncbi:YdcF family protein [Glutamicibacter sp. TV12E]|uniref:YdcF family protein n=1 Tax=Glutamicibacter sp. TV12E TaxID=3446362 RepID=UPI004034403D
MGSLLTTIFLWLLLAWLYRREPRRLRNAVVLSLAVLSTLALGLTVLETAWPDGTVIAAMLILAVPFAVLVFGFVLIYNGVLMLKREGRRLSNLLSMIFGLLVLGLPAIAVVLVGVNQWWAVSLAFVLFVASGYVASMFAMLLLYAWFYGLFPIRREAAAIIVLGSRAINGRVTPLLRSRLDRGIELYRLPQDPAPLMVPSGGQGADEIEPEGESMARYLREQGVAEGDILIEDRAKDTAENLRFSAGLVRAHRPDGQLWIVTSDYHNLRAGLASRAMGYSARTFGSKTAAYYRPSAFLREFIAIMRDRWGFFAMMALPFTAVLLGGLLLIVNSMGYAIGA